MEERLEEQQRQVSTNRVLRSPTMDTLPLVSRSDDAETGCAYSKAVLIVDMVWNISFVVVAAAVLLSTFAERPSTPLRLWLCGYAFECLLHVAFVYSEYCATTPDSFSHTPYSWNPDAINFDSSQAYTTPSYWVQYLFRESNGATFLNSQLQGVDSNYFAASAIRLQNPQNNKTSLKIKVANLGSVVVNLKISLKGLVSSNLTESTKTIIKSGNPMDESSIANPKKIIPQQSKLENPGSEMNITIPPVSFTVFDLV